MDFFDKVGQTISGASSKAQQSLKTMSDINALNGQISTLTSQIQSAYYAIGQAYAEAHKDEPEAEFAEQISAIQANLAEISNLQLQINQLKGIVPCPNCGSPMPLSAAFCPNCGAKNEAAVQPAPALGKICPNCGMSLSSEAVFCPGCGAKLQ